MGLALCCRKKRKRHAGSAGLASKDEFAEDTSKDELAAGVSRAGKEDRSDEDADKEAAASVIDDATQDTLPFMGPPLLALRPTAAGREKVEPQPAKASAMSGLLRKAESSDSLASALTLDLDGER